jgi:large subunit ribosomal protein L13e
MVKHNNVIPNIHCKKKYLESSRGPLKVKLALNQAGKKKSRRLARAAKAAAIAPRPLKLLRPAVHCPTQRYSAKVRLGKGFTLEELKAAGLTAQYARTVGIAVDHRRTNRCNESLTRNVARLEEYKSKLVVFPKKRLSKVKNGDSSRDECKAATQFSGTILPLAQPAHEVVMGDVPKQEISAYTQMRTARQETKIAGYRMSVANRKE